MKAARQWATSLRSGMIRQHIASSTFQKYLHEFSLRLSNREAICFETSQSICMFWYTNIVTVLGVSSTWADLLNRVRYLLIRLIVWHILCLHLIHVNKSISFQTGFVWNTKVCTLVWSMYVCMYVYKNVRSNIHICVYKTILFIFIPICTNILGFGKYFLAQNGDSAKTLHIFKAKIEKKPSNYSSRWFQSIRRISGKPCFCTFWRHLSNHHWNHPRYPSKN